MKIIRLNYDKTCNKVFEQTIGNVEYVDITGNYEKIDVPKCDFIYISNNEEAIKLLDLNKIQCDNIILSDITTLNESDYNFIKSLNHEVKIRLNSSLDIISNKEYIESYESLICYVEEIKKYNLTELEQIMYAYDLVRSNIAHRIYKNDHSLKGRSVSSVLLTNYISNEGYVDLFNNILRLLGINSRTIILFAEKDSYYINQVVVNDNFYGINKTLCFDPTADRRREKKDNYLNYYVYFGKSLKSIIEMKKHKFESDTINNEELSNEEFKNLLINLRSKINSYKNDNYTITKVCNNAISISKVLKKM